MVLSQWHLVHLFMMTFVSIFYGTCNVSENSFRLFFDKNLNSCWMEKKSVKKFLKKQLIIDSYMGLSRIRSLIHAI